MNQVNTQVTELIKKYPALAKKLHYLGIHFYNYSEETLEEICRKRGVDASKVATILNETVRQEKPVMISLEEYPLELIIEYLKHNHYIFIKDRLPYLTHLIENYSGEDLLVLEELKLIFPHFAQEFIAHIYEEEDTLFAYILWLKKVQKNKQQPLIKSGSKSILEFEKEHHLHDDEMRGIRELTQNYVLKNNEDVHLKVILENLKNFGEELKNHAKIENNILFPKALDLENALKNTSVQI